MPKKRVGKKAARPPLSFSPPPSRGISQVSMKPRLLSLPTLESNRGTIERREGGLQPSTPEFTAPPRRPHAAFLLNVPSSIASPSPPHSPQFGCLRIKMEGGGGRGGGGGGVGGVFYYLRGGGGKSVCMATNPAVLSAKERKLLWELSITGASPLLLHLPPLSPHTHTCEAS